MRWTWCVFRDTSAMVEQNTSVYIYIKKQWKSSALECKSAICVNSPNCSCHPSKKFKKKTLGLGLGSYYCHTKSCLKCTARQWMFFWILEKKVLLDILVFRKFFWYTFVQLWLLTLYPPPYTPVIHQLKKWEHKISFS